MNNFTRITQNPTVMGGKPCIRGLRVTVGNVVGQIGAGRSIDDVLADYPYLEREDILESLRYAAWRAQEREWGAGSWCLDLRTGDWRLRTARWTCGPGHGEHLREGR